MICQNAKISVVMKWQETEMKPTSNTQKMIILALFTTVALIRVHSTSDAEAFDV